MSTATATPTIGTPRIGTKARGRSERSVWTCPNCRSLTHEPRKRCRDCGTSRY